MSSAADAAVKIVVHPVKGRCYYATRPIRISETVLQTRPFIGVPAYNGIMKEHCERVCMGCLRWLDHPVGEPIRSALGSPFHVYCSRECEARDWECYHRFEYPFFKDLFQPPASLASAYHVDYIRLLSRAMLRRLWELVDSQAGTSAPRRHGPHEDPHTSFASLENLCSNESSTEPEALAAFKKSAAILEAFLTKVVHPELESRGIPFSEFWTTPVNGTLYDKALELICKEEVNVFGLYNFKIGGIHSERQCYASAVYTTAVFFNHSCAPNVGHHYIETAEGGGLMTFFALRDIQEGEELLISYVPLSTSSGTNPRANRRAFLKHYFQFDCDCARCESEDDSAVNSNQAAAQEWRRICEAYICGIDSCRGWRAPRTPGSLEWVCVACGGVVSVGQSPAGH
ncbi:uncharacterized protein BJ171DRAFT_515177 [Polychytrium aggregatum]|uniref:uncharacterized protein n=1 Tax=Polychytrium aggregatum TaxID=110093 RepID=UPI0022FDDFDA|nr:uncharacterized protein BJ171DRAFT_515177 [Polychytrium aggregatum]KAI9202199.1 hypothetical protein BJ171DRAFT_515177 [Polychytrium aggregatum]